MFSGAGDVQVVELPDAIKTVLVQWNNVKLDLNELARLRWIEKMSIPQISHVVGKCRSVVQVSIRTIRNCGVSQLNLPETEKKVIQNAILEEIAILENSQPRFSRANVSSEFQSKGAVL